MLAAAKRRDVSWRALPAASNSTLTASASVPHAAVGFVSFTGRHQVLSEWTNNTTLEPDPPRQAEAKTDIYCLRIGLCLASMSK